MWAHKGATGIATAHGKIQLIGYLVMRGGLLLASAGALVWVFQWLFALWLLPRLVVTGLALMVAGLALVMASLVAERVRDERTTDMGDP